GSLLGFCYETCSALCVQETTDEISKPVVQPGQSLTISCQVSGYSLTDSSYGSGWIRQREGKPMDWIVHQWGQGSSRQNEALKNKFSCSRDMSAGTVTITGQNLQPEDTAVYYCVRVHHSDTNKHKPVQKLNSYEDQTQFTNRERQFNVCTQIDLKCTFSKQQKHNYNQHNF
uniref:Ig-like domain-containing protein n=1 Tax=Oryzias melastigma TaxID=30732 RepID=A0A3B3DTJ4_ORYME